MEAREGGKARVVNEVATALIVALEAALETIALARGARAGRALEARSAWLRGFAQARSRGLNGRQCGR